MFKRQRNKIYCIEQRSITKGRQLNLMCDASIKAIIIEYLRLYLKNEFMNSSNAIVNNYDEVKIYYLSVSLQIQEFIE